MYRKIYKKCLFFILFLLLNSLINAQTIIKGTIKYNNIEFKVTTNVILKENNNTIAYTFSNEDGSFELSTDQKGKLMLQFSSMNFETKILEIDIPENSTKPIVVNPTLIYKPIELNEVILSSEKPITVKKDTVTFLTKSFAQGNEQVVEDLLKKIPGLNISDDGTIKVGNQEVEKVMVDGDDFFERGYKILTKNMPANPVEKVEVLQRYSNNKHLKGIENSDKVALNLTLKEDFKRQWFGNVEMGYGLVSENRYQSNANLMNFGKKNKYFFITNFNNTGYDATGDINHLIRPYRDDGISSVGDNASANTILRLGLGSANLKQERVNFNNAEMLSLNSIFTINKKIKAKVLGFFNTDENDFFRNSSNTFFGNNTNFTNTEDFVGRKTNLTGFGKFDLTYDISKTKTLEYTAKFNKANLKEKSDLLFNNDLLNENITSRNELLDHKMIFTNKFKENKVFVLTGRYIKEKTPQAYTINKFLLSDLFSENANNTAQTSENKMEFYGFEAHLLDKKSNENLLEIQTGNQLRIDFLNTQFTLKNNETILSEPFNFMNNIKYSVNDLYLKAKYVFKIKDVNLMLQSNFHQFNNTIFENNISNAQNPFFINPKIGLEWEINPKSIIVTSYSYNTKNARILDVYSNNIQTSFRSFDKATGTFNQLDETTALLNYTYGGWSDKFFANAMVIYSKNFDFFSSNSILAPNYSLQEKILIKDRDYLSIGVNMDRYMKFISSNLKVNLGGSKSNFKNSVNNSELREVKNQTLNYGFEIRSGFRGVFNYHLGSKWDFNQVKTTISNEFTNNMSFLDLSFVFNKKFNIDIQSERYFFGNLDQSSNKYYFTDLEARYMFKENKLTFSLSGNNLFNTETFRNYSISDINISNTEYRLLPRYVLLKMQYRF